MCVTVNVSNKIVWREVEMSTKHLCPHCQNELLITPIRFIPMFAYCVSCGKYYINQDFGERTREWREEMRMHEE